MEARLEERLAQLPTSPGVYLMRDREGSIIYVGKAVNLRSRVRSYFTRSSSDSRAFVGLLDRLLGDVETMLVSNEKEALLLENELIKKHKPRFNVQLRDDKNFICLRLDVTGKQSFPRLEVVRRFRKDGARYFGPYASAASIRETLRVVNRHFQLRTCSDHVLANRRRPCLLHQIGRCPAPCVYDIPPEEYRRSVDEVSLFLEGKTTDLVDSLASRMRQAASELKYEEAARLRDQLRAVERSLERQKVAAQDDGDRDVFGFYREADRLLIYVLYARRGRMGGGQGFYFSGQEFPDEELLASFVNLYYQQDNFVPDSVLLPFELDQREGLEELLSERKGSRVRVVVPRRGEKVALVELAAKNAAAAFTERKQSRDEALAVLERLQSRLDLSRLPRRIECYDVSHFQGRDVVASLVTAVDGEPDKSGYRRFKVKGQGGEARNDDFANMYEIISRRLKRSASGWALPDLMVIDGGKGQLGSALAALKDAGIDGVDVVGLAKSRELETVDPDAKAERSPERVFVPGRKEPIVLSQRSPELFVLTRLRDEAHRFAITFQERLGRRRVVQSSLEAIPGIGEGRRRALLRHFGSLKRVREATIEELAEVEGLGPAVAERVHTYLHGVRGAGRGEEGDAVREASLEDVGLQDTARTEATETEEER